MSIESKIEALVQGKTFKRVLPKIYSIGASVVILGALFKIEHWPGSSYMLSAGLITESVIFFFYAFDSTDEEKPHSAEQGDAPLHAAAPNTIYNADGVPIYGNSQDGVVGYGGAQGSMALARFDEMLLEADISTETFERLGMGIRKLGETTENLNSMGDVAEASHRYMRTLQTADESLDRLTKTYEAAIGKVTSSTIFKYQSISKSLSVIEQETRSYQNQVENLNDNLTVLNKIYRKQRKAAENYLKSMAESADESARYQEQMKELNENINSLNRFYGNVLTTMKVRRNKLA